MANFFTELKKALDNASNALAQTQQNMYTAPATNKITTASTTNKTNTTAPKTNPTKYETAQAYAQAALSGESGKYIPASQTANAVINAGVPITPVQSQRAKPATTATSSSSAPSAPTADYYSAYSQAVAQQEALYKQQEELAAKQRDEMKKALEQQNDAIKKQRENALNRTIAANNQSADNSLRQAYTAYMLSKRNLDQQLRALGISGGGSETVLADMANTYANNRFGIEDSRNTANATARQNYDAGINSDYIDYIASLAKIDADYNNQLNSILANKGKALQNISVPTAKTATTTKTTAKTTMPQTVGLRIGNDSTVYTTGADLLQALKNMGFTQQQAVDYAKSHGVKIEV